MLGSGSAGDAPRNNKRKRLLLPTVRKELAALKCDIKRLNIDLQELTDKLGATKLQLEQFHTKLLRISEAEAHRMRVTITQREKKIIELTKEMGLVSQQYRAIQDIVKVLPIGNMWQECYIHLKRGIDQHIMARLNRKYDLEVAKLDALVGSRADSKKIAVVNTNIGIIQRNKGKIKGIMDALQGCTLDAVCSGLFVDVLAKNNVVLTTSTNRDVLGAILTDEKYVHFFDSKTVQDQAWTSISTLLNVCEKLSELHKCVLIKRNLKNENIKFIQSILKRSDVKLICGKQYDEHWLSDDMGVEKLKETMTDCKKQITELQNLNRRDQPKLWPLGLVKLSQNKMVALQDKINQNKKEKTAKEKSVTELQKKIQKIKQYGSKASGGSKRVCQFLCVSSVSCDGDPQRDARAIAEHQVATGTVALVR